MHWRFCSFFRLKLVKIIHFMCRHEWEKEMSLGSIDEKLSASFLPNQLCGSGAKLQQVGFTLSWRITAGLLLLSEENSQHIIGLSLLNGKREIYLYLLNWLRIPTELPDFFLSVRARWVFDLFLFLVSYPTQGWRHPHCLQKWTKHIPHS